MKRTPKKRGKSKVKGRYVAPYDFEFKIKVVRLYLEEKYQMSLLAQELGVICYSIYKWAQILSVEKVPHFSKTWKKPTLG